MGREFLCIAGRRISDHFVVIVDGEWEENFCVTHLKFSDKCVLIVDGVLEVNCCVPQLEELVIIVW
jgi:hypothetical protein